MPEEVLEFEKIIVEREALIKSLLAKDSPKFSNEIKRLRLEQQDEIIRVYGALTPWEKVQLARHPARPQALDYIQVMFRDFIELHGDRLFRDDAAVVGGFAWLKDRPLVVIGQQRGRSSREKVERNFGMARPEGYRKAQRLMRLAERFELPLVTFIDTPGADPGIGAEERGQAAAIGTTLYTMGELRTRSIAIVIGEGGSGGALAFGVADRLLMMAYSIFSVISPEGCAAILWKEEKQAPQAAQVLKLTAQDGVEFGFVDESIAEPSGGAHFRPSRAVAAVRRALRRCLRELDQIPIEELVFARQLKYREIGIIEDAGGSAR